MALNKDKIVQELLNFAAGKFSIPAASIDIDGRIAEQLHLDSLSMADIIIEIEEIFKFEFEEEDLDIMTTLGGLADVIEKHLAEG